MAVETPVRLRVRTPLFNFLQNNASENYVQGHTLAHRSDSLISREAIPFSTIRILKQSHPVKLFYRPMIPTFHITASIHPPTVGITHSTLQTGGTPASSALLVQDQSDPPLKRPNLEDLSARIQKLEEEVFKSKLISDNSQVCTPAPVSGIPVLSLPGEVDSAAELSAVNWSSVFDIIIKRLDSCASQPSVNECILSMRSLKKDLAHVSDSLKASRMSVLDAKACDSLLANPASVPEVEPIDRGYSGGKKDASWWRSSAPRSVLKAVNRPSPAGAKKWGSCFYCPCTDWKPGHTCEGSRLAQQRKLDREIHGA